MWSIPNGRLFQKLVMWNIPDEGYSKNWSCGAYLMNLISTLVIFA
jgi:hypothetical protein